MEAAPYATVMSGSMWSFSSFPKYDLSISFTLDGNEEAASEYGLKVQQLW